MEFEVSQKVLEKAKTIDEEKDIIKATRLFSSLPENFFFSSLSVLKFILVRIKYTRLKNTITVSEDCTAHIRFNLYIYSPTGIFENMLPSIVNKGYPVGCAIPNLIHTVASSPVSIKYNPGANVVMYTTRGIINEAIEKYSLFLSDFKLIICLIYVQCISIYFQ